MGWSQTFHALCNIGMTVMVILVSHLYNVKGDVVAYNADNSSVRFSSMPSNFGVRIPSDGLEGYLVSAEPYNGCSQMDPPPDTNQTMQATYIALIRRNDCDFDEKVLNAQRAGYLGAIVHNVGSNSLVPMSGAKYAGQVFIPSVFVGEHDGLRLGSDYNYTTGSSVKITPGFVFPYHIYLIPFASIVGVCFILMVGFMIAKYVRDRRRLRRARLSRDHLKKLPIKKFKKGDDYDVCAICLDEYEDGDKLRILPCNHAFHNKCVDPWLTNNRRTCPVCKRKVVPNGVEDSSDDDSSDEEDGPTENTPLLTASNNTSSGGATGEDHSETAGSLPSPKTTHVDASTAMTPAEDSDEESAGSSSDSYEMAHAHPGGAAGISQPLQPVTEIQIEHEVVVERPDETDDSDDELIDDENARLQKV